jgi:cyclic pyranopterin phosphate synthase
MEEGVLRQKGTLGGGGTLMVKMVDVGSKESVRREAVAAGSLSLKRSTISAIRNARVKKGDVLTSSKLAGIQAAKATSSIIMLCHNVPLTSIDVDISVEDDRLDMECAVSATYKTGVEMEALVGVAVALLNAWDMVKYLEKDSKGQYPTTRMSDIRVVKKTKEGSDNGNR